MEALVAVVFWTVIFLLARFNFGVNPTGNYPRGAHGTVGSIQSRKARWQPPERTMDPVCGALVRTDRAKPSLHDGMIYYFCSRDCREIFEAAPDLYVDGEGVRVPELNVSGR